jgi:CRISPR-associated protein Cmr4
MTTHHALLGLFTETSLHAGSGQSLGVIDLPIQREAHTHWPCVYGSAVKGALRARAEAAKLENVDLIFGQADFKAGEASEFAAALAVGDARLLLLPVRSLTGHFRWVTCPAALRRFQRDASRLGLDTLAGFAIPDIADEATARVATAVPGDALFLEEYRVSTAATELAGVVATLSQLMPDSLKASLENQLTLVHDDLFRHLAEHATPVTAHVRLDERKTVEKGALWYEESLPPETLLYTVLNATHARKKDSDLKADAVIRRVRDGLFNTHPYLQLGGNETTGMGWCRVHCIDTLNDSPNDSQGA